MTDLAVLDGTPATGSRMLSPSVAARLDCRAGMARDTAGVANGFVQGNLAILPEKLAESFHRLLPAQSEAVPDHRHVRCRRSPHSRARRRSRHPHRRAALSRLARRRGGRGADRHHGALARRSRRLRARLFVLVRGSADGRTACRSATSSATLRVPMYRTNIALQPAGPFAGRWWCRCGRSSRRTRSARCRSPRAFRPCTARRCISAIRSRSASRDIAKPDYGDAVPVGADEIPVFWACGVTPQAVIAAAKLPFAITHAPGLMLVTDLRNKQLAVI